MRCLALSIALLVGSAFSSMPSDTAAIRLRMDSIQAGLHWQTDRIRLPGDKAELLLPEGYRYLDSSEARVVLEDLWGNPTGDGTWGMVFGPGQNPMDSEGWGAIVSYSDDGHVDDKDAAKTDFDDLLSNMKKSAREANKARIEKGYDTVVLHGWAESPHYDPAGHKLYWAKDLEFGGRPVHTLNYFVRILGREGVLEINAVSSLDQLAKVKDGMVAMNASAEFTSGNRYADFDKKTDRMSELGVAALVAGGAGIAAKVGLFKWLIGILIAAKKLLIVAVVGIVAAVRGWWSRRRTKLEDERFGGS